MRGIALVQVLLLTAILSVLLLYFTTTSRQQIALAQGANDRAQAIVDLKSAKNKLLFQLLTRNKVSQQTELSRSEDVLDWNFFSMPFSVSQNVKVSMQDQSALLSAQFLNVNLFEKTLIAQGYESEVAYAITRNMLDWQDLNQVTRGFTDEKEVFGEFVRQGKVPDLTDFTHIPGVTPEILDLIRSTFTIHYAGRFNPKDAPYPLLEGMYGELVADQVDSSRQSGYLSVQEFKVITGQAESEEIWFTPSDFLKISFSSEVGDVVVEKEWIISLRPYSMKGAPFNYLEVRG